MYSLTVSGTMDTCTRAAMVALLDMHVYIRTQAMIHMHNVH